MSLLSRRGDVGKRDQAEYSDRSDPRSYLRGLPGGSTYTERQPAIVSVFSAGRIYQAESHQVAALGRWRSHMSIIIGIDDSYLRTLGTGNPVDQTTLHEGRRSK